MTHFSIRSRLVALAAAGALAVAAVGAVSALQSQRSRQATELLEQSTVAVRASMQADMVHDAMRAELLRAALKMQSRDFDALEDADKRIADATNELLGDLATAEAQAPSGAAREAVRTALPVARRYSEAARAAIASLRKDPQQVATVLPTFEQAFHEAEGALEKSGTAIEQAAGEVAASARDAARRAEVAIATVSVVGLLALGAFSLLAVRSIMVPLRRLRDATRDLNAAGSDLTRRLPPAVAEFGQVAAGFNQFLDTLMSVVGRVHGSAQEISSAGAQIASGNLDLSQRTEQAASSLQQAAASVEQITATVHQTAEAARQANELAANASAVARKGGDVVAQVVRTMEDIHGASRRIADIIGVIDGIAFQTNILALNAAVEAARAGEQGRGFAVVAGEVRSLAQRSAGAAREIKSLIGTSVEQVESGSRLVEQAGQTMSEIVASVRRVTEMIGEITTAAGEQSAGIGMVNDTVTGLDQATQQNAALVEETAAAARQLSHNARDLADSVAMFRTDAKAAAAA